MMENNQHNTPILSFLFSFYRIPYIVTRIINQHISFSFIVTLLMPWNFYLIPQTYVEGNILTPIWLWLWFPWMDANDKGLKNNFSYNVKYFLKLKFFHLSFHFLVTFLCFYFSQECICFSIIWMKNCAVNFWMNLCWWHGRISGEIINEKS
jgi:hypothetical protein